MILLGGIEVFKTRFARVSIKYLSRSPQYKPITESFI